MFPILVTVILVTSVLHVVRLAHAVCLVDLNSFGQSDFNSSITAWIRLNDITVFTYTSNTMDQFDYTTYPRGVTTAVLNFTACTASDIQHFDTDGFGAPPTKPNAVSLANYISNLTVGMVLLGITLDDPSFALAPAVPALQSLNINVSFVYFRGKFAFVVQKGYPNKTLFENAPSGGNNLNILVNATVSSMAGVTFIHLGCADNCANCSISGLNKCDQCNNGYVLNISAISPQTWCHTPCPAKDSWSVQMMHYFSDLPIMTPEFYAGVTFTQESCMALCYENPNCYSVTFDLTASDCFLSFIPFQNTSLASNMVVWTLTRNTNCSQLMETPVNQVVAAGSQVILNCSSDTYTNSIYWQFTPIGLYTISIGGCAPGLQPISGFSFSSPTPYSCNLFITSVVASQAGLYSCLIAGINSASAELVVISLKPGVACLRNIPSTADGVSINGAVTMTVNVTCFGCNSAFSTYVSWPPIYLPSLVTWNSTNQVFAITTSAAVPEVPAMDVVLNFTSFLVAPSVGYASDLPPATQLCSYSALQVQYAPFTSNITISGALNGTAYVNNMLTCNATTVPPILYYQWTDPRGITSRDSNVVLQYLGTDLLYQCTVINSLGSGSLTFVVSVVNAPTLYYAPVMTEATVVDHTSLIIGLCVGIGIPCLIVLVTLICIIYLKGPCHAYRKLFPNKHGASLRSNLPKLNCEVYNYIITEWENQQTDQNFNRGDSRRPQPPLYHPQPCPRRTTDQYEVSRSRANSYLDLCPDEDNKTTAKELETTTSSSSSGFYDNWSHRRGSSLPRIDVTHSHLAQRTRFYSQ